MASTKIIEFTLPGGEKIIGYRVLGERLQAHPQTIIYWKNLSESDTWFMFRNMRIHHRILIKGKEITDADETKRVVRRNKASYIKMVKVGNHELVTKYVNGYLHHTYSVDAYEKINQTRL